MNRSSRDEGGRQKKGIAGTQRVGNASFRPSEERSRATAFVEQSGGKTVQHGTRRGDRQRNTGLSRKFGGIISDTTQERRKTPGRRQKVDRGRVPERKPRIGEGATQLCGFLDGGGLVYTTRKTRGSFRETVAWNSLARKGGGWGSARLGENFL